MDGWRMSRNVGNPSRPSAVLFDSTSDAARKAMPRFSTCSDDPNSRSGPAGRVCLSPLATMRGRRPGDFPDEITETSFLLLLFRFRKVGGAPWQRLRGLELINRQWIQPTRNLLQSKKPQDSDAELQPCPVPTCQHRIFRPLPTYRHREVLSGASSALITHHNLPPQRQVGS